MTLNMNWSMISYRDILLDMITIKTVSPLRSRSRATAPVTTDRLSRAYTCGFKTQSFATSLTV